MSVRERDPFSTHQQARGKQDHLRFPLRQHLSRGWAVREEELPREARSFSSKRLAMRSRWPGSVRDNTPAAYGPLGSEPIQLCDGPLLTGKTCLPHTAGAGSSLLCHIAAHTSSLRLHYDQKAHFTERKWGLKKAARTSLVAQGLGIHLPMQETQVRSLVWEDPTCHGASKPVPHHSMACGILPASALERRSLLRPLLSPSAATTDACLPRADAQKQEKPPQWKSHTPQLEKAYAAAKSLQSCPTLCDPIDGSPPGSLVPGILQARTLEWVAISFFNAWKWKVKVKSLSHDRLFVTPRTPAYQALPSMGFSRQEYWRGVPLPSPTYCMSMALFTQLYLYKAFDSFPFFSYIKNNAVVSFLCIDVIVFYYTIRWISRSQITRLKSIKYL